jgi:hypothetical protein
VVFFLATAGALSLTLSKTWQHGLKIYFSGVLKNAEFYADLNSIKKRKEKIIRKLLTKTVVTVNGGNSPYFLHFFGNNF